MDKNGIPLGQIKVDMLINDHWEDQVSENTKREQGKTGHIGEEERRI
jgi:hypothetical protein